MSVSEHALADDSIGLLEGLTTTRAIRRYTDDPIPEDVLRDILFAATRGSSGSNRQPFRFLVLTDSEGATAAKKLIATSAQAIWGSKRKNEDYDKGSGKIENSPKSRMANTMQDYVDNFTKVPCLVFIALPDAVSRTQCNGGSLGLPSGTELAAGGASTWLRWCHHRISRLR